ncbi:CoA transferase [Halovenus sp. WSH3]|uniref:CoA transferase n=1 Tax=Halovenus carboxidivorans TaxID=2692199 RepID=A0A6B0TGI0_9EURY|nr:CaiB/BaiF CoA-transferase family protein [Halovenus carboxidivorans]MXR52289.1 CoA transferase [Halovenus carboxidivorans]
MQLDSVRVLDLSRLLPGPYATQLLADAGAEVIKIEDTGSGDYARAMPPYTDSGVGAVFDAVNRGKKGVALDLKSEEGQEALYRLAEDADVLLESFRPEVVDRLGVDYDRLSEINEDLVYCSLTGYGQGGPMADSVGHDLNYVGRAGMLDLTREDETARPQVPGYTVADMAGGLFAAFGIVSALLTRELGSGGGEYIDVAMTDVVLSFSQAVVQPVFEGDQPRPGEGELNGGYPWYDVYECADGRYVTFAALEPQFFRAFCEAVDREDLIDAHMTDDDAEREALRAELTDLFGSRSRDEWMETLDGVEASVEPVYTLTEALDDEQVGTRDLIWDERRPRIGFPAQGTDVPRDRGRPVPKQGEHTEAVLREVGYDDDELDRLAGNGVIRRAE